VSGSGITWAICKSAPHSRQITTPAPHRSVILQAGCPSCRPTNSIKALKTHCIYWYEKGKGSPYSITKHRVQELIPVFGSQPAGDVSHKPGGRLPLLSARPAVTPTTIKRAATNFAAW